MLRAVALQQTPWRAMGCDQPWVTGALRGRRCKVGGCVDSVYEPFPGYLEQMVAERAGVVKAAAGRHGKARGERGACLPGDRRRPRRRVAGGGSGRGPAAVWACVA